MYRVTKAILVLSALLLCTGCATPAASGGADTRYRCDEIVIDSEACWDASRLTPA